MPKSNRDSITTETGEQVPARPHDSGSAANETVDGLDATTEAIRHATEDTPLAPALAILKRRPSLTVRAKRRKSKEVSCQRKSTA